MKLISPYYLNNSSEEANADDIFPYIIDGTIKDMSEICAKNNGIAIAAPQVGIFKKFFISLISLDKDTDSINLYINPYYKLIDKSKEIKNKEGCLSYDLGKAIYSVSRYDVIQATWLDISKSGELVSKSKILEGPESIIFQHETDHLNGITIASNGVKDDK